MNHYKRKLVLLSRLVVELPKLRQISRATNTWEEIFDVAHSFAGGFLNPLQVKSEIIPFLSEVERRKPRRILEIGTAQGGNFFLLARAAAPDAHLISLDLPGGLGGGGYSPWKTHVYRRLLIRNQTATFIRADSHAPQSLDSVRAALKGSPVDLLFIDGDHTHEGVKQDFSMYSELVHPEGLIALHDIVPNPAPECKVDLFWNELRRQVPVEEFVHDWNQGTMGIGVVRKSDLHR
jgi:predicted O-methyltransferase YrrM